MACIPLCIGLYLLWLQMFSFRISQNPLSFIQMIRLILKSLVALSLKLFNFYDLQKQSFHSKTLNLKLAYIFVKILSLIRMIRFSGLFWWAFSFAKCPLKRKNVFSTSIIFPPSFFLHLLGEIEKSLQTWFLMVFYYDSNNHSIDQVGTVMTSVLLDKKAVFLLSLQLLEWTLKNDLSWMSAVRYDE